MYDRNSKYIFTVRQKLNHPEIKDILIFSFVFSPNCHPKKSGTVFPNFSDCGKRWWESLSREQLFDASVTWSFSQRGAHKSGAHKRVELMKGEGRIFYPHRPYTRLHLLTFTDRKTIFCLLYIILNSQQN